MTTPAIPSGSYSAADTPALISSVTPASAVGTHGRWSEKNVRVSSRLAPENGIENENQNSASRHRVGRRRAELAALVDEARERLREHRGPDRGRDQEQRDHPHAVAARAPQPVEVMARGEARQRREQHGRHRDREDALRQHVEAEGAVDRGRRPLADQRAQDRVDQQVEVDQPEPDRDRQHQPQDPADPRVAEVEGDLQLEADAPQHGQAHAELDDGAREHAERVGVELVRALEQRLEQRPARR